MDKLFLLDAYALIYRSYYAFMKNPRINSKGLNTSCIMGFCNTLNEILTKEKPTHIGVAFDHGKTFRHEAFPAYKAQREETPEDIKLSVPIIKNILDAYHIPILQVDGFEADDVIGTLATKAGEKGVETYMLTPDKDYGQLVKDNVYMYRPQHGGGYEKLGTKEIEEKYIHELMAYKIEGLIVLSNTISSEELASYKLPVVTIERECDHVCSVSTDNYLGGVQATSLLIRNKCDVILHINSIFPDTLPTYGRIRGFEDICNEHHVVHELIQRNLGNTYQETLTQLKNIFNEIEEKYPSQKKGVFLANDTYASMFLNLIFQKYGKLPKDYQIVGFDDSPIASEAILPITTVGQQIEKIAQTAMELLVLQMNEMKKRKPAPLKEPVHKQITPVLIRRDTTK